MTSVAKFDDFWLIESFILQTLVRVVNLRSLKCQQYVPKLSSCLRQKDVSQQQKIIA